MRELKDAFDIFFHERVIGDKPFGWDNRGQWCVYNHDCGGGCAIGTLLPRERAAELENGSFESLVRDGKFTEVDFVDHRNELWQTLQSTHDAMARLVADGPGGRDAQGLRPRNLTNIEEDQDRVRTGLRVLATALYPVGSPAVRGFSR